MIGRTRSATAAEPARPWTVPMISGTKRLVKFGTAEASIEFCRGHRVLGVSMGRGFVSVRWLCT